MASDWEQFKIDMSSWISPEALEQWATQVTTDAFDVRAVLLQLAARFDRGKRMGEALQLLEDFATVPVPFNRRPGTSSSARSASCSRAVIPNFPSRRWRPFAAT